MPAGHSGCLKILATAECGCPVKRQWRAGKAGIARPPRRRASSTRGPEGPRHPTLLPGRLHLACLTLFMAAAFLRYTDDLEFVDDGESGLCACRFW